MAKLPTKRQLEVFEALKGIIARRERPTYRALAKETGLSLSYVYSTMLSLEKKNLVTRIPEKHGGLGLAAEQ